MFDLLVYVNRIWLFEIKDLLWLDSGSIAFDTLSCGGRQIENCTLLMKGDISGNILQQITMGRFLWGSYCYSIVTKVDLSVSMWHMLVMSGDYESFAQALDHGSWSVPQSLTHCLNSQFLCLQLRIIPLPSNSYSHSSFLPTLFQHLMIISIIGAYVCFYKDNESLLMGHLMWFSLISLPFAFPIIIDIYLDYCYREVKWQNIFIWITDQKQWA